MTSEELIGLDRESVLFLLNRHEGIGDVVLATGAILGLAKFFPDTRFTVVVSERNQYIFDHFPENVEIVSFENPYFADASASDFQKVKAFFKSRWLSVAKNILQLRRRHFKLAVGVREGTTDFLLMRMYGAQNRMGFPTERGEGLLTHPVEKDIPAIHMAARWQKIYTTLTGDSSIVRPTIIPRKSDMQKLLEELSGHEKWDVGLPTLLVHTGASTPLRKWEISNFCKAVLELKGHKSFNTIWFCQEDEASTVADLIGKGEIVFDFSHPLGFLIAAIQISDVFLGNDSGPMHIAAACDKAVVAVFGPTLPELYGPYSDKSLVVNENVCKYHPCHDNCKFSTPICMASVAVANVSRALQGALDRASSERAKRLDWM
ncbi:MAG: glycosyltransferase family 9 protein [Nitrososphaerota archaeon]|nr:glycosyltransferase family 9 protein [Nitrososphaerota archaeon]